ncbi:YqgE/AlgH family protein [Chitinivorax sp. PXF-14]|uniref:YqgE/AlgH family protein n=1 Tax=Chitinivorax sp. PXF-14 TaxID=3230488 RepID=UPI0034652A43
MQSVNLTNHFLIAMPNMADPYFQRSLTYICEHNENGALGIVVNRPIDLTMEGLFEQIGIELSRGDLAEMPVYFGGPVQMDRGFVLHNPLGSWQSTMAMNESFGLTTSKDILQAVGEGRGPGRIMVTLGYAGWDAGQLEQELAQNAWLTVEASQDIIFEMPAEERYDAAMHRLGVDFGNLSDQAGHA